MNDTFIEEVLLGLLSRYVKSKNIITETVLKYFFTAISIFGLAITLSAEKNPASINSISCCKKEKISDLVYPSRNPGWKMVVDTNYPPCVPADADVKNLI